MFEITYTESENIIEIFHPTFHIVGEFTGIGHRKIVASVFDYVSVQFEGKTNIVKSQTEEWLIDKLTWIADAYNQHMLDMAEWEIKKHPTEGTFFFFEMGNIEVLIVKQNSWFTGTLEINQKRYTTITEYSFEDCIRCFASFLKVQCFDAALKITQKGL